MPLYLWPQRWTRTPTDGLLHGIVCFSITLKWGKKKSRNSFFFFFFFIREKRIGHSKVLAFRWTWMVNFFGRTALSVALHGHRRTKIRRAATAAAGPAGPRRSFPSASIRWFLFQRPPVSLRRRFFPPSATVRTIHFPGLCFFVVVVVVAIFVHHSQCYRNETGPKTLTPPVQGEEGAGWRPCASEMRRGSLLIHARKRPRRRKSIGNETVRTWVAWPRRSHKSTRGETFNASCVAVTKPKTIKVRYYWSMRTWMSLCQRVYPSWHRFWSGSIHELQLLRAGMLEMLLVLDRSASFLCDLVFFCPWFGNIRLHQKILPFLIHSSCMVSSIGIYHLLRKRSYRSKQTLGVIIKHMLYIVLTSLNDNCSK